MKTSVYLSNDEIQIIIGSVSFGKLILERVYRFPLPGECMINGMITNEELLEEKLRGIWQNYKLPRSGIYLAIESSRFVMRKLTIPIVSEKNQLEILKHEFADATSIDDPLFDYSVFYENKKDKKLLVMASAVDSAFIAQYIKLFASLKLKLSSISSALISTCHLLKYIPGGENKTVICQILDGNICTSFLYANGTYLYSNSQRMFNAQGTPEFSAEVFRSLSGIMQFHASEKIEFPVTDIYFGGFDVRYTYDLLSSMTEIFRVNANLLPNLKSIKLPPLEKIYTDDGEVSCELGRYINAISNLLGDNVLAVEKDKKEKP